uniref:(northern house mosquito) hypothetical protein n=1 Tax=Culex pipiens TaxID=7175 RepID=A0A8D8GR07_CULPI
MGLHPHKPHQIPANLEKPRTSLQPALGLRTNSAPSNAQTIIQVGRELPLRGRISGRGHLPGGCRIAGGVPRSGRLPEPDVRRRDGFLGCRLWQTGRTGGLYGRRQV